MGCGCGGACASKQTQFYDLKEMKYITPDDAQKYFAQICANNPAGVKAALAKLNIAFDPKLTGADLCEKMYAALLAEGDKQGDQKWQFIFDSLAPVNVNPFAPFATQAMQMQNMILKKQVAMDLKPAVTA